MSAPPPAVVDAAVKGAGEAATALMGGKRSAWMVHVKKTMKAHKGMKLGAALKLASKTFKKSRKGGAAGGVGSTALPLGGRRRRGTRRTRKH